MNIRQQVIARLFAAELVLAAAVHAGGAPSETSIVHEWGTFTTLTSSSGLALTGLYKDESRLPDFVHGLPFFNYSPTTGWPDPEALQNVTVKMETPILYFYCEKALNIEVEVGFKGGTISQWYPQRVAGELNPSGPSVDMAQERTGRILWKAKVLAPEQNPIPTPPPDQVTQEWSAPRIHRANSIRGHLGEVEKFLFYRGLGNFPVPLEIRFTPDGQLSLSNRGTREIAHVMVYELPREASMGEPPAIWWEGKIGGSERVLAARPVASQGFNGASQAINRLREAMIQAGLYPEEASAMLQTWANSYFSSERGLKAFWIVPREDVDEILPLRISPVPRSLERVIVGRSDILTPEFERELIQAEEGGTLSKYESDKYYLAYLDFLARRSRPLPVVLRLDTQSGRPKNGSIMNPGRNRWLWETGRGMTLEARDLRGRNQVLNPAFPLSTKKH